MMKTLTFTVGGTPWHTSTPAVPTPDPIDLLHSDPEQEEEEEEGEEGEVQLPQAPQEPAYPDPLFPMEEEEQPPPPPQSLVRPLPSMPAPCRAPLMGLEEDDHVLMRVASTVSTMRDRLATCRVDEEARATQYQKAAATWTRLKALDDAARQVQHDMVVRKMEAAAAGTTTEAARLVLLELGEEAHKTMLASLSQKMEEARTLFHVEYEHLAAIDARLDVVALTRSQITALDAVMYMVHDPESFVRPMPTSMTTPTDLWA